MKHNNTILPPISANTLFHFTKSIDNLVGILTNEFYPSYSLENWNSIMGYEFEVAIPMVCFCDIPLSQIQNHTCYYGNYALGLSKEWGMKNHINPVLYTYKEATTSAHIIKLTAHAYETLGKEIVLNLALYMKPYEGKLWRNGKYLDKMVRFYDEREWRYIPKINESEDRMRQFISPDDFHNEEYKEKLSEKLKSKKLSFQPNDIKYIIIEKESEILDMVYKVRDIKTKFPPDDIDVLITRIISMDQIREDF